MLQSVPRNARRRGRLLRLARAIEEGKSVSSLASQARMVPPRTKNRDPSRAPLTSCITAGQTTTRLPECQSTILKVAVLVALNGAWLCSLVRAEQIETVAQVAKRIDARLQQMENMAPKDTATALAQSFL